MTSPGQDIIRVVSYETAAAWVRQQGGSCTSPLAVEFGMEDAWRVQTTTGPTVVRPGDSLIASAAGIEFVRGEA